MAEKLIVTNSTKIEKYNTLYPQVESLIADESNLIANAANIAGALKQTFDFFWVGFYFVENNELVLGPFQGPIACTRIAYGKGVCGQAWKLKETILVPDVEKFPGHISCNSLSKSEIVIPGIHTNNTVLLVLDVDSDTLNDFDSIDKEGLEKIVRLLVKHHEASN